MKAYLSDVVCTVHDLWCNMKTLLLPLTNFKLFRLKKTVLESNKQGRKNTRRMQQDEDHLNKGEYRLGMYYLLHRLAGNIYFCLKLIFTNLMFSIFEIL